MTARSGLGWPAGRVRSRWKRRRKLAGQAPSPFALLGLDPAADLADDDVLASWRRIAAATHPDRPDGGDPAGFAAAAAAYTELRTPSGRGEARAALAERSAVGDRGGRAVGGRWPGGVAGERSGVAVARHRPDGAVGGYRGQYLARIRLGRPVRLALRVLGAAGAAAAGSLAAGPGPAGPALQIGALTWLVLTVRRDLYRP